MYDKAFVERRRTDLEKYMQTLYLYMSPYESEPLEQFLLFKLHVVRALSLYFLSGF